MKKVIISILLFLLVCSLSACKQKHVHNIIKIEAREATCTQDGSILFYCCSTCGVSFADSEGKKVIIIGRDTVVEKTGHQYDNNCDSKCNKCDFVRDIYHVDKNEDDACDECGVNIWGEDYGVDLPIDKN